MSDSRRTFLKSVAATMGANALGASSEKRPNFVFFLGEGARADEFGFAGNRLIQTPHFDRLAREGTIFRNAFVTNSLCSPSRASILTGLYSHATGLVDNRPRPIPESVPTFADLLREAGYEVALFGKVHVHELSKRNWDCYFGVDAPATNYYHPMVVESRNGKPEPPKVLDGYFDDLAAERAVEWLNQKREKPFCLLMWFMAPHAPFYRARRHADLYNGVRIPKPKTFDDDLKGYPGKPRIFLKGMNKIGTGVYGSDDPRSLEELVKDHYAGVVATDEGAGRIVAALESMGALDDTVIINSSDHGFFLGEWGLYNKMLMHEPSVRVPLTVRYPRLIRPGAVCDRMALNVDIAPTMLELAGVKPPERMHGRSLVPLVKGERPANWREDWLYEYYDERFASRSRGVRTERHKLIHYWEEQPEEFELYDLEADPGELNNLYGDRRHAKLIEQLKRRIEQLHAKTA